MTAAELIAALSVLPPDMLVMKSGQDGGVDDIASVARLDVVLNAHDEDDYWLGAHEFKKYTDAGDVVEVAYIRGTRH